MSELWFTVYIKLYLYASSPLCSPLHQLMTSCYCPSGDVAENFTTQHYFSFLANLNSSKPLNKKLNPYKINTYTHLSLCYVMVQAEFLMSQLCSCLHHIPNSDSIKAVLSRVTDWGWGVGVRRHLQQTLSLDQLGMRTCLYFREVNHNRRELCLPPLKCICVTIYKLKILHLRLICLVAFSGTQHMEVLRWQNTVTILFLDTFEPLPCTLLFFYKCVKYYTHQRKAAKPEFKIVNSWCHFLCSMKVLLWLQREFECSPLNHCFHLFRKYSQQKNYS